MVRCLVCEQKRLLTWGRLCAALAPRRPRGVRRKPGLLAATFDGTMVGSGPLTGVIVWERFAPTLGEQSFPALTLGRRRCVDLQMVSAPCLRRETS
jgi:hypothetical protein